MNNARRKMIVQALSILGDCLHEEEEALGNMPENLEGSEKYEEMEENGNYLTEAMATLREIDGMDLFD